uniref:Uncharacterized protein n=1 Tax=Rhizophora mucronata TaxID=61149 RepID=A0A2P2IXN6_RHIMU
MFLSPTFPVVFRHFQSKSYFGH